MQLPDDNDQPAGKILFAGRLQCLYDEGNLRYIKIDDIEVVRKIYGAVRLHDWETAPLRIVNEKLEIHQSSFVISYTAYYEKEHQLFSADYRLEGSADNVITVSMKGVVQKDFMKSRIGLCVLNPLIGCCGKKVMITEPDGSKCLTEFPDLIKPTHAFNEVAGMEWEPDENVQVKINFHGEIFETEDQRNWSDASFKTYSTPQRIPFPVAVKAGDIIEHRVTIAVIAGNLTKATASEHIIEERFPFPKIGVCKIPGLTFDKYRLQEFAQLPLAHLRVPLTMNDGQWVDLLQESSEEALQMGTSIALVCSFSENMSDELDSLIAQLKVSPAKIKSILILDARTRHSSSKYLQGAYEKIKTAFPEILIGFGTDRYFADLNRNRPEPNTPFDFLSFTISPQVHAFDNRTILENIEGLPDIMRSIKIFSQGKPIWISPLGLRPGISVNSIDTRANTWFAATWLMFCLQNLGEAECIDLFDLSAQASLDENTPTPIVELLSIIGKFKPVTIIRRTKANTVLNDGLMLENANAEKLFIKKSK